MVRIQPEQDQLQATAKRLLAAADSPSDVATDTNGSGVGFNVSEELARKAGFLDDDDQTDTDDTDADGDGSFEPTSITEEQSTPTTDEPPRTGRGSSETAWREFLTQQDGFTIPDDADRGELIAAWDAHTTRD